MEGCEREIGGINRRMKSGINGDKGTSQHRILKTLISFGVIEYLMCRNIKHKPIHAMLFYALITA